MSDEEAFGRAGNEAAQGFVPLADPPPPEEREYGSDQDGLKEAASDLVESRRQTSPVIERKYTGNGAADGEEVPANRTIDQKRAVHDLTVLREVEALQTDAEANQHLAQGIDHARAAVLGQDLPAQPEQPAFEQQPEAEMAPESGIDPEIQKALENPKIRHALETEMASVESARHQYAQATTQAAQVAAAALYANFPELSRLTTEQLPVALQIMAQQNPQRHAQVTEHLNHTRALYGAAQQAQAQQQQMDVARFQNFTEQQDRAFDEAIKSEPPETVKQVKTEFLDIAEKHYGIPRKELVHLIKTEPILRTAVFQKVLYDAAKYQIAMRGAKETARPEIPHVQRPGVSKPAPSGNDTAVTEARQAFHSKPNPKTAAALLRARRSA